jgi:hypothetical protein
VGDGGRESDRVDSAGAALQPRPTWSHLLPGRRASLHLRIVGAHHERRVHGRSQLRPIHSPRRAMERASRHAGLLQPHCHRALHSLARLRPLSCAQVIGLSKNIYSFQHSMNQFCSRKCSLQHYLLMHRSICSVHMTRHDCKYDTMYLPVFVCPTLNWPAAFQVLQTNFRLHKMMS